MLIKRRPDTYEKLHILGGMATDDILSDSHARRRGTYRGPYSSRKKNPIPGVYRAAMPNGKFINLFRVMFTDFCKMDCHFCPNSHWVPRKRHAFKIDELAKAFMELHQRHTVDGLFLSSGVAGTGSKTTERLVRVVEIIRKKYDFKGYVHLKVMPGTERQYVEAAHELGTRLSINMETPTLDHMKKLSKMKDLQRDILSPMEWINDLTRSATGGAVGQATQLVVGAADESDVDIADRVDQLYDEWDLKRVYYAPFHPVRYTPLEEHPATPPMRSHRLYQLDWLRRVYDFPRDELTPAFNDGGFLPLEFDPKTTIALENIDAFPIDVNNATRDRLLRVPGIGPTSAKRILHNRRRHTIDTWRDLQAMGVVKSWAWPFLAFPGHRPPRVRQTRLDFSEKREIIRESSSHPLTLNQPPPLTLSLSKGERSTLPHSREGGNPSLIPNLGPTPGLPLAPPTPTAPCGLPQSCNGCEFRGAPGHPS